MRRASFVRAHLCERCDGGLHELRVEGPGDGQRQNHTGPEVGLSDARHLGNRRRRAWSHSEGERLEG